MNFGGFRLEVRMDLIGLSYRLIFGYTNSKSKLPKIQNDFSQPFLELSG